MKSIANTTIRFGMIALPAQVCATVESGTDPSFGSAGPNGETLRQTYVDPAGNEIPRDQWLKGVWDNGAFTPIDPTAITAITEATKLPDLSIIEVIEAGTFWGEFAHRITGRYFIQSAKKGGNTNAFKLFVDALAGEDLAVVTKWTARSRQKLMVMIPQDGNLVAYTLSFQGDVRDADETVEAHKEAEYTEAEMGMAKQILGSMVGTGDSLVMEEDEAVSMKSDLIEQARLGKAITAPTVTPASAVGNLADALGAMLAAQAKEKELRGGVAA